jgi:hypothetical protein
MGGITMISSLSSWVWVVSFACLSGGSLSPRPLFDLKILEPVFSQSLCRQLLIGQSFVKGRENKAVKPFERMIFDVSEIQTERKFSNVSLGARIGGLFTLQDQFRSELEKLCNRFSRENESNTPDFVLADYLIECLNAYDRAKNRTWKFGHKNE